MISKVERTGMASDMQVRFPAKQLLFKIFRKPSIS